MLKTALIGVGTMGKVHLENLIRFTQEKEIIELTALCDVNPEKFKNAENKFNIEGVGNTEIDYSKFRCYTDSDEMIKNEKLDLVIVAVPTYLHCEITLKCLNAGIHTMCEKPMALNVDECQMMHAAAEKAGKKLMIGQVLRFWGEYETAKQYVESGIYGKPTSAVFFRGGGTPLWSYNNWLLKRECGGGALHDLHVHDVDMINYLFGMPRAVTTLAKNTIKGSGYDIVSTNYHFDDDIVVNAQSDWVLAGNGFEMTYRINFEHGSLFKGTSTLKAAKMGEDLHDVDFDTENAYYKEVKYFANTILDNGQNDINPVSDSVNTIKIVSAETKSADNNGKTQSMI